MTLPIRQTDADVLAAIEAGGSPRGIYMACDDPKLMHWRAVDTRNPRRVRRCAGDFSRVLGWCQVQAFVLKSPDEETETRVRGEKSRGAAGVVPVPERIPGAEVLPWTDEADPATEERRGGWGSNTIKIRAPEKPAGAEKEPEKNPEPERAAETEKIPEPEKIPGPVRTGRPKGSLTGPQEMTRRQDAVIRRMVLDGADNAAIAREIGKSRKTVNLRIRVMRAAGEFPEEQLPAWRVHEFEINDRRKRRAERDEVQG